MNVLLFSTDLMTTSQVEAAAREAGAEFTTASSAGDVLQRVEESDVNLVILDLSCPALEPASLVPAMKEHAPTPRIIAFGPHVHGEKLSAAEAAGCDQVLSRGQFMSQAADVLGDH